MYEHRSHLCVGWWVGKRALVTGDDGSRRTLDLVGIGLGEGRVHVDVHHRVDDVQAHFRVIGGHLEVGLRRVQINIDLHRLVVPHHYTAPEEEEEEE